MSAVIDITPEAGTQCFAGFADAIVLFHKELCPHCKNMLKVLEKFGARAPDTALLSVDSEARPELMAELGFERVPTLVFLRNGAVAKVYTGLMNPRELQALHAAI